MTFSYSNGTHSFEADSLEGILALIQATVPSLINPALEFIEPKPVPALLGTEVSGTVRDLYDMGVRVADDGSDDALARIHLYPNYAYTWESRDQPYNPSRAHGQYSTPGTHFNPVRVIVMQDGDTLSQAAS